MMYAEVGWVLVSSGTQFQPEIIFDPSHLPNYSSVSYDYAASKYILDKHMAVIKDPVSS